MKHACASTGLALLVPAAACATDFTDTATVVSATPIRQQVNNPRQDCWQETVTPATAPQPERGYAGPVAGGVAGGLIGSQVGKGTGSVVATGIGAAAGTIAGDRVANGAQDRSLLGPLVGAVAGGLLGAQIGKGNGQKAATAAGAIAGAMVGDRLGNPAQPQAAGPQTVQRCREVNQWSEQITGYTVVYRYNGREFTTTLPRDPGPTLRVAVKLDVVETPAESAAVAPAPAAQPASRGTVQYQYTHPR